MNKNKLSQSHLYLIMHVLYLNIEKTYILFYSYPSIHSSNIHQIPTECQVLF